MLDLYQIMLEMFWNLTTLDHCQDLIFQPMPEMSWNVSHGTLPQHQLDFYLSKNYMGGQMKGDEIRGSEARMHPGGEGKQLIFFY